MFTNYRIKSKFRFTIFVSTVIVLFFTLTTAVLGFSNASGLETQEYRTVVVKNGDTLWNIASENCDNSDKDIRKTIYEIETINKLDSHYLQAGQELVVPVN